MHVIGPELGLTLPGHDRSSVATATPAPTAHSERSPSASAPARSNTFWPRRRSGRARGPHRLGIEVTGRLGAGARAQRHHPGDHPQDRHRRGDWPRDRVLRAGDQGSFDGRTDDDLQHVDRGRCPGRTDRPRRRDDRLRHADRTAVRAARSGAGRGDRRLENARTDDDPTRLRPPRHD